MSDHYLNEAVVVGIYIDRSLNDFIRACEITIQAEQEKVIPDTELIALLCDAVRLTREMTLMAEVKDLVMSVSGTGSREERRGW